MSHNIKPNFLIVGSAKSGTTSLYHYINDHQSIFMSQEKEPMFFVSDIYTKISRKDPRHKIADNSVVSELGKYISLFSNASSEHTAIGEASAAYLYYYKTAIPLIKQHLGDIKIIIILRNPTERAYSSYTHLVRDGVESASFEEFLQDEENRKNENWDILNFPKSLGLYYDQINAYMNAFSNVKIVLLDDLKKDSQKTLEDIYHFLGVAAISPLNKKVNKTKIFNKSSQPKSKLLHNMLNKKSHRIQITKSIFKILIPKKMRVNLKKILHKKNQMEQEPMKAATRNELDIFFKDDILKTQKLINRNLSHWISTNNP